MLINTVNITAGSKLTISGLVGYNKTASGDQADADWRYFANIFAVHDSTNVWLVF